MKRYRINSKLKNQLLSNGFSKESIKEMFCRKCGKFGFDCICQYKPTMKDLIIDANRKAGLPDYNSKKVLSAVAEKLIERGVLK